MRANKQFSRRSAKDTDDKCAKKRIVARSTGKEKIPPELERYMAMVSAHRQVIIQYGFSKKQAELMLAGLEVKLKWAHDYYQQIHESLRPNYYLALREICSLSAGIMGFVLPKIFIFLNGWMKKPGVMEEARAVVESGGHATELLGVFGSSIEVPAMSMFKEACDPLFRPAMKQVDRLLKRPSDMTIEQHKEFERTIMAGLMDYSVIFKKLTENIVREKVLKSNGAYGDLGRESTMLYLYFPLLSENMNFLLETYGTAKT